MDKEIAKEVVKEIGKDVYADGAKPVVKPTGELLGLVPRAIKAALSPLEKWILRQEYNIEETKKLLEEKLENIPPEMIEGPEPHIAVPAIQYISYCMDNEELRDMYANLLANSMIEIVKNGIHPSFIEIIKQLSPDEARIMNDFKIADTQPTISLRAEVESGGGIVYLKNYCKVGILAQCERPNDVPLYFDNLKRLGLIELHNNHYLADNSIYEELEKLEYIQMKIKDNPYESYGYTTVKVQRGYAELSEFGKLFCRICIGDKPIIMSQIKI